MDMWVVLFVATNAERRSGPPWSRGVGNTSVITLQREKPCLIKQLFLLPLGILLGQMGAPQEVEYGKIFNRASHFGDEAAFDVVVVVKQEMSYMSCIRSLSELSAIDLVSVNVQRRAEQKDTFERILRIPGHKASPFNRYP